MSKQATLQDVYNLLLRINEKISNSKPKPKWVKVTVITELTGWGNEKMRRARINNVIDFKKDNKGRFWYDLNTLPTILIKQKSL